MAHISKVIELFNFQIKKKIYIDTLISVNSKHLNNFLYDSQVSNIKFQSETFRPQLVAIYWLQNKKFDSCKQKNLNQVETT